MPTPKQVRHHFGRLSRAYRAMQAALNAAHDAEVLVYKEYEEESPCFTNFQSWERILATTEKQLARAMREEIQSE